MKPAEWAAVGGIVLACAIFAWSWWRGRLTPAEKERRRRAWLHRNGRIAEAMVTEIDGDLIFYGYSVQGVHYTAAQDLAGFASGLPAVRESLVGPAACKYQRNLPANSIVICEEWSGIRHFRKDP